MGWLFLLEGKAILRASLIISLPAILILLQMFFWKWNKQWEKYCAQNQLCQLFADANSVDRNVFAAIGAITKTLEKRYTLESDASKHRSDMYSKPDASVKLSDVFNVSAAHCVEIALLAQKFLQSQREKGFNSSFFSGECMWDRDDEYADPHSFVVIRKGEKTYVYDPANPVYHPQGKFPRLHEVDSSFDTEMRKGQKRFMQAKNIFGGGEAYYGVNNGTNVYEKYIVSPAHP